MEFKIIHQFSDLKPKDIIREPQGKRLYEIIDIDLNFSRVMLRFYVTDHEADEDRKILVHQEALINRWEKLI